MEKTKIRLIKLGKQGCRPCEVLSHVLAEEHAELEALNVELIEKSISEEPELIDKYGISGVPVLIFERNGIEMARISGLCSIVEVYDAIDVAKNAK